MSLKERIQKSAIKLFNEDGISSVTMRQIAIALEISPGNLTYHYKTKSELLSVIYAQIHVESNDFILTEGYITLHDFQQILERFYGLVQKYQFFFNDIAFISKTFPEVAKMYEQSNLLRFKQARKLIDYYIASDRIIPENEYLNYDLIVYNLWMINTFWSTQERIINLNDRKFPAHDPVKLGWQILFPYLTKRGIEEYKQIKKFVKK